MDRTRAAVTAAGVARAGSGAPRRLTAQRQLVAQALRHAGRTVGAVELFDTLRAGHPHLGRATVFRTLDLLVELGLAQRFEGEGHVYLYTSCEPVHHHHLVCRTCGGTTDIDDAEVDALINSVRRRHAFLLDHQSLDFYGTCARCPTEP
jgi:Fur family ferric uptake transcriptional regulator